MEVFECHGLRSCKGDALELSDYVATGILVGVVLVSQLVFQLDKYIVIRWPFSASAIPGGISGGIGEYDIFDCGGNFFSPKLIYLALPSQLILYNIDPPFWIIFQLLKIELHPCEYLAQNLPFFSFKIMFGDKLLLFRGKLIPEFPASPALLRSVQWFKSYTFSEF